MFKQIKYLWWTLKCLLGLGSVEDGSICWFSKNYWNVHDFPKDKGGNGYPDYFITYTCSKCSKKYTI